MNAKVNVVFYVLTALLAFFSRKIFLDCLGTEFLGLSGTLGDILGMMNITELGIGTAVGVTLYKPLFDRDEKTINEIISVFGFLYTRVGKIIGAAGIIVSLFFPLIFEKADIPLFIPYLMFYGMLYGSLLGYFINYKTIILSASQNNYIMWSRYNSVMILKGLAQIAVCYIPYNYIWWILLEIVAMTVYSIFVNRAVKKNFPWLSTSPAQGRLKFKDYGHLWTKTKQIFVFKISNLVFTGSINIFIGVFASLSSVTLYGNYNMLMCKITSLIDKFFFGMEASVGNLIAEGNKMKTLVLFKELLSVRYFLASVCSLWLFFIVPRIIAVWLGDEYILSTTVLGLLSLHMFIQQARITVSHFKDGYGLFSDVWAPIAEILICVFVAGTLGYFYKLPGILLGYVLAELLIKMIWQPYYLFKKGFKSSVINNYWTNIIRYIAIIIASIIIIQIIDENLPLLIKERTWISVICYSLTIGVSIVTLFGFLYWIFDAPFRGIARRLISYQRTRCA